MKNKYTQENAHFVRICLRYIFIKYIQQEMENKIVMPEFETFYYFLRRFEKPQRDAEKNNKPLRSSASSSVNLFSPTHRLIERYKYQQHQLIIERV
ncbi:MAG: hypothetical protein C5S46_05415 [Candidatus Methanomarinus sp.]|uniref:Uncharacterized protein n=1 Tax=Candidatus Methanomarinus sp. TaxID=3386244 RepID=A0AC61S9Z8_9EURY|nr:MAG: hypothetical protein C5S46_05415 [ANME-2 cluster archaeon]